MSVITDTIRQPVLAESLQSRLAQINVSVGVIDLDGRMSLVHPAKDIDRLIVHSPLFTQSLASKLDQIRSGEQQTMAVWPGLWLTPLPVGRRRRVGRNREQQPIAAAVVTSELLFTSDEFALLCDQMQLDRTATINSVDPSMLIAESNVPTLAQTICWLNDDSQRIGKHDVTVYNMSQQLAESYEELSLLYKLSTNMLISRPPGEFLLESCRELQQVAGVRWLALQLIEDDPRLNDLAGKIFVAGEVDCDEHLLKRLGKQLMHIEANANEPMVIDDLGALGIPHLARIAEQLLLIPLVRKDGAIGILIGSDKIDQSQINSVDCKLCSALANSLNIFLENMMLFDDMQAIFMGTLHALTSSIDAKDSYTRGHSERVAMMSRKLGKAAGLNDHDCERVYIAGLLHDVGKIGVPESVLTKPGKLTNEEFAYIKKHPEVGAQIISDIRQMSDVVPGVLCHHERWDGRGYPEGLAGENIPIYGRVIGLADAFDAMSSTRTYRAALPIDTVLNEIAKNGGTQFDPRLAEIFINLDLTDFFEMIEKHNEIKVIRSDEP